jgi:hypothetical protein
MTDRDTFAASALTGMIASREWPIDSEEAAHYCYRVADAMLRERLRTPATQATPSEGSVQDRYTLTAEEQEAILTAADLLIGSKPGATLRKLLERLHT